MLKTISFMSAVVVFGLAPLTAQYCAPQSTGLACGSDEYISNVTITDPSAAVLLNNNSLCVGPPALEYFGGVVAPVTLTPGVTYGVSVTVGTWWSSDQVRVWLDTDNNFSFEDANDTMVTLTSAAANTPSLTLTGSFTVPPTALNGASRLRVRLVYGAFPTPASCANAGFGNTEDYDAIIGSAMPQWQVNQPGAYVDFDGVLGTPFSSAVVTKCAGAATTACASSFGNLADIFLNVAPTVPASGGGIVLGPNIVNLDLSAGFVQLFGSLAPVNLCPISFGAPVGTLSAQMIALDFTSPTGLTMSQASQLTGIPATNITLPNADDQLYLVNVNAGPLCHVGAVNFYGTSYSQIVVSTNGIVFPGNLGNNYWIPTAAAANTNPGGFGLWSDWRSNANPAATIVVNGSGVFGGVDVTYTNVPFWSAAGSNSTFNLGIDASGPRIEGLSGLGTSALDPTMIFISIGGGLATNPGPQAFALSPTIYTANPATDMLYNTPVGGSPAVGGGANNIWGWNAVGGGYGWSGN